jgi:hypothetical protein
VNWISRRIVFGLVISVFLLTASVYSQTAQIPQPERARTIFDYKKELNLTDRQEQDIKTILEDLNKEVRVTRAKLTLLDVEVSDLIKNEGDLEQIRRKLKDAADVQVALRLADLVATRKINKTLSPEQLKKWREMQSAAAKQQK